MLSRFGSKMLHRMLYALCVRPLLSIIHWIQIIYLNHFTQQRHTTYMHLPDPKNWNVFFLYWSLTICIQTIYKSRFKSWHIACEWIYCFNMENVKKWSVGRSVTKQPTSWNQQMNTQKVTMKRECNGTFHFCETNRFYDVLAS